MQYLLNEKYQAIQFKGDETGFMECLKFCPAIGLETYRCNQKLYFRDGGALFTVCKGDWILLSRGKYSVVDNDAFNANFLPVPKNCTFGD